ncbi:unnamed protein product, partial [Didymodactylos carnosus]
QLRQQQRRPRSRQVLQLVPRQQQRQARRALQQ